jgi:hypothetical protein
MRDPHVWKESRPVSTEESKPDSTPQSTPESVQESTPTPKGAEEVEPGAKLSPADRQKKWRDGNREKKRVQDREYRRKQRAK